MQMMNRFLIKSLFLKKMTMKNLSTQIQHLIIRLKETTERYNLGQNKRFKMLIRAIGLLY